MMRPMVTPNVRLVALASALSLFVVHCSSASSESADGDGGGSDGGTASSDGGTSSDGESPSNATVTDVTPDQATAPAYVGVLANGNLIVTEGQALRVLEMDPSGKVLKVNSTDFTGFEWPRSIAVDDTGRVFVAGYQQIHTFAKGPSDPRQTYVTATAPKQAYDWIVWGGTPKRLWALTGSSPTAPKMQFVKYEAATATAGGAPTVVAEVDRFPVMSFTVDDQNNVFAVDSNSCRVRKVTPAGVVSVIAGKPAGEQGVCNIGTGFGKDSAGNWTLPQAGSLGWDPTGKKLVLSGAGKLFDMTEQADGKSKGQVLHTFPESVANEGFASTTGAMYVIDKTAKVLKKVVF